MTVQYRNRNFSEINLIEMIHRESGSMQTVSTHIKSGSKELSDVNFLETDFKYFQDKLDFSRTNIMDNLYWKDKTYISREGQVEKFSISLFPTNAPSGQMDDFTFYYSTYTDIFGNELICLLVDSDVYQIKLFEARTLAIDIRFGDWEIGMSKVLYILTSYKNDSPTILNLSYTSYLKDKNANGEMSNYVLRNDSLVSNYKGYHEESGYVFSDISGSLFGTSKIENRPIYNLIQSMCPGRGWNRSRKYSLGSKVMVGNTEYESLIPDNIGNHPYYSRYWAKSGAIISET